MAIKDVLPGITKAALEIAYDNGGINRDRSEEDLHADLDKFFRERTPEHSGLRGTVAAHWQAIDGWLNALSEDALLTVCAGEEQDVAEAMVGAPPGTDVLLTEIFECVA